MLLKTGGTSLLCVAFLVCYPYNAVAEYWLRFAIPVIPPMIFAQRRLLSADARVWWAAVIASAAMLAIRWTGAYVC